MEMKPAEATRNPFVEYLRRHKTALLLGLAVVTVGLYYIRFIKRPAGVTLFPLASSAMLQGVPLESVAPGFTYPPFFALVMIPLVPMPMWLRNVVWYLVLVAATWACFRLCEHLTRATVGLSEGRETVWLRVLTALLSLKVTLSVFENQAFDVLLFLCVLVGLYGMVGRKPYVAAVGFALAAALKVTPLLLFPYLLLRRQFKVLLLAVGFYAVFSLLPDVVFPTKAGSPMHFVTWAQEIAGSAVSKSAIEGGERQVRQWDVVNPLNQSLRGYVYQLTSGPTASPHFKVILYSLCAAYGLAVLAVLLRSGKMINPWVVDGSLLLITMLMLSPMSSKSHFVVLMLPYMLAIAYVLRDPRVRRLGGILLGLSFALITLTSRDVIGSKLCYLLLSYGAVTIGTLMLAVFLAYVIFKSEPVRS